MNTPWKYLGFSTLHGSRKPDYSFVFVMLYGFSLTSARNHYSVAKSLALGMIRFLELPKHAWIFAQLQTILATYLPST